MLKIINTKKSIFQGQQKKLSEQKVCIKEKILKSVRGCKEILENAFSKIVSFFCEYLEIKTSDAQDKIS